MPFVEKADPIPSTLGLVWLLRLRWFAVAGQIVTCLVAALALQIELPVAILAACIAFTALSNALLSVESWRARANPDHLVYAVIGGDILVLTIMLYVTGGSHNPFTTFYILEITIAAILLPAWATWAAVALCGACFGLLFTSDSVLVSRAGLTCCTDMTAHLQGMVIALLITGAGVAYFVSRLSSNLAAYRASLIQARELGEREQRFAGLATLAAGVAHELATPLATIAVVSKDLESADGQAGDDARLIRQEVDRCRGILERLGEQARDDAGADRPESVALERLPLLLREYLPAHLRNRFDWEVTPRDAVVEVPVATLLRALSILVKNGCEASPDNGRVHLGIRGTGEGLTFAVRDHGEGMSRECVARLGEPFFTTKAPGVGMGLGLFLVRIIVERLHGRWAVTSTRGEGTLVELVFPARTLPA